MIVREGESVWLKMRVRWARGFCLHDFILHITMLVKHFKARAKQSQRWKKNREKVMETQQQQFALERVLW